MLTDSEAKLRARAEDAEKRLARAESRLASMAGKGQTSCNRPLERAIPQKTNDSVTFVNIAKSQ